jgi:hypothetical protein
MTAKSWPAAVPGSGGGPVQNAKAQSYVKQSYGKGKGVASKHPNKKSGMSGDSPKARKALSPKKK